MARKPHFKPLAVRQSPGESGTAMVEFLLATGLLIIPIFFGIIIIGLSLVLANQVTEVCRDAGHMFAYGVDLSQSASQVLVTQQLGQGLGMTPTSGRGVIYLSQLLSVDGTSCTSAGLQANTTSCPNMNQIVVIKRLIIGNSGVQPSAFAPGIPSSIISSNGSISPANYLTNPNVRAPSFGNVINLSPEQWAFVSEMFVNPPVGGLWSLFSSNVVAARSVF